MVTEFRKEGLINELRKIGGFSNTSSSPVS
jgi:hypothetical protein